MLEPKGEIPPACLNCGEPLQGSFCSQCGQEAVGLHRPLRELASDFLDNVLNLDTRLLRTVPLLFRPGRLTREYLAGRRARYVRPLRLYLMAALLFFAVLALWPQAAVRMVFRPSDPAEETVSENRLPPLIERGLQKAEADPERFAEILTASFPRAFFLLLPVFALLLKLLYLRRGFLYLDHLVFAFHYHAFAFVIMAVLIPVERAPIPSLVLAPIGLAFRLWLFVYLLLALRTAYSDSWRAAGLRCLGLMISYGIVYAFALFGLLMIALYRLQA